MTRLRRISSSRTKQAERRTILEAFFANSDEDKDRNNKNKQASSKKCGLFEINVQKTELGNERKKSTFPISAALSVARLLVGVSVPNNVVGQAEHLLACTSGHLCEAFRLGLVLEGVRGEINACDRS
jgi:hypothetical protein